MSIDNKSLWDNMIVRDSKISQLATIVEKIKANKARYEKVSAATSVPWYVIGAIHYREASLNFTRHLHNGDKLTSKTIHVPAGRPIKGNPPFTWEESATDALKYQKLDKVTDWGISNTLDLLEKYNGLGYRKKGLSSPYLWSFTSNYETGKYVADGKFDPLYVDGQCGVAPIIKLLM